MQILVVVAMILTELFGPLVHAALKTEVEHVSVGTAVVYGSVDPKPKVKHRSIAVPKPVEREKRKRNRSDRSFDERAKGKSGGHSGTGHVKWSKCGRDSPLAATRPSSVYEPRRAGILPRLRQGPDASYLARVKLRTSRPG